MVKATLGFQNGSILILGFELSAPVFSEALEPEREVAGF